MQRRSTLALLLLATQLAVAQPVATPAQEDLRVQGLLTPAAIRALIDRLVPEQLRTRRIAGAVVSVVKDGTVIVSGGYGEADVSAGRRMGPDTRVRLASITKMFTALAVMQLVERGALDLDRDVNRYLDFAVPAADGHNVVTLRRLLSHRTAFENRTGDVGTWIGGRLALGPYLTRHLPPRLPQDDDVVAYSNVNSALAAYVVERVSGELFEDYLKRHIFAPLQMTHTSAQQPLPATLLAEVSNGYVRSDLPPTQVSMGGLTVFEVGSAGITSTASDMARLMLALVDDHPRIVTPQSLTTMMTSQSGATHGVAGLGLFSPAGLAGGNPFVGHDGRTGGFSSTVAVLPAQRFGVFVSYNSNGMPAAVGPQDELLGRIAEREFTVGRASGDPVRVQDVIGTYEPASGAASTMFALQRLFSQITAGTSDGALTLRPAVVPFGDRVDLIAPGIFRWRGRDVSFGRAGRFATMSVGSPVGTLLRVPWWRSATLIGPLLIICLFTALAVAVRWIATWLRRLMVNGRTTPGRAAVIRAALCCHLSAIAVAIWFVFAGWPLAAASSPSVVPLALTIYGLAWSGVVLTPVAIWKIARPVRDDHRPRTRVAEGALAAVALFLSLFCLSWRIAGTSLAF